MTISPSSCSAARNTPQFGIFLAMAQVPPRKQRMVITAYRMMVLLLMIQFFTLRWIGSIGQPPELHWVEESQVARPRVPLVSYGFLRHPHANPIHATKSPSPNSRPQTRLAVEESGDASVAGSFWRWPHSSLRQSSTYQQADSAQRQGANNSNSRRLLRPPDLTAA